MTEALYTINGVLHADDDPDSVEFEMDMAWAGATVFRNGAWTYLPGATYTPVRALTVDDVIEVQQVQLGPDSQDRVNVGFMAIAQDRDSGYMPARLPPRILADELTIDGHKREVDLGLRGFVNNLKQAERVLVRKLREARPSLLLTLRLMPGPKLENLGLHAGDIVTYTDARYGLEAERCLVQNATVNQDMSVSVALRGQPALGTSRITTAVSGVAPGSTNRRRGPIPPKLTAFSVTEIEGKVRSFEFTLPEWSSIGGVRIREAQLDSAWGSMGALHGGLLAASPYQTQDPSAAGTYWFEARVVSQQGVESEGVRITAVLSALDFGGDIDADTLIAEVDKAIKANPVFTDLEAEITRATDAADTATAQALSAETQKTAAEAAKTAAETAKDTAKASQDAAAASATEAEADALAAGTQATNAAGSATAAAGSATTSSDSASASADSATAAASSASASAASATTAAGSADAASTSADAASASSTAAGAQAEAAKVEATKAATQASNAATSATAASESETNADGSAKAAAASLTTVEASATKAKGSEDAAATSAQAAATAAMTAQAQASEAGEQAKAAKTSSTAAATSAASATTAASNVSESETNADGSAKAAAGSAMEAEASATKAGTEAGKAATSATAAATSETNAAASASGVGTFATAAETSATKAGTEASRAGTQANNAAMSATAADGSATAAATSAQAAAAQATNAAGSATAAASSASTASASATGITQSVQAAEVAKTAAETAQAAAETAESNASAAETNADGSAAAAATSATNAAASATGAADAVAGISATVAASVDSALASEFASAVVLRAETGDGASASRLELVSLTNLSGSRSAAKLRADNVELEAGDSSLKLVDGKLALNIKSGGGVTVDSTGVSFDGASVPRTWKLIAKSSGAGREVERTGTPGPWSLTYAGNIKTLFDSIVVVGCPGLSNQTTRRFAVSQIPTSEIGTQAANADGTGLITLVGGGGSGQSAFLSIYDITSTGFTIAAAANTQEAYVYQIWGVNE